MGRTSVSALGLVILLLSGLFAEQVLYSRNTLAAHPELTLAKSLASPPPMGATEATQTRNLLAQNRLNLGAWHGFQEVLLGPYEQPAQVRFWAKIPKHAYLCVNGLRTAEKAAGFRLSRSKLYPSMAYRSEADRFVWNKPLEGLSLDDEWHRFTVFLEGDQMRLQMDGRTRAELTYNRPPRQGVSFRNGTVPVWVDDLRIASPQGVLLVEDFRHDHNWAKLFALALIVLTTLSVLVSSTSKRLEAQWDRRWLKVLLGLLLAQSILLPADFWYWSSQYHHRVDTSLIRHNERVHPAEQLRVSLAKMFDSLDQHKAAQVEFFRRRGSPIKAPTWDSPEWLHLIAQGVSKQFLASELREMLEQHEVAESGRVLLLGSSQTFGEGADLLDFNMGSALQRSLAEHVSRPTTVLNVSMQGTHSRLLLGRLPEFLETYRPSLVVVNLGSNDRGPRLKTLATNLTRMKELSESAGADFLMVLEPNIPEATKRIRTCHAPMIELGQNLKIPVLDLHGFLTEPPQLDGGFLWCDHVHLTSYGQTLAGRFMAEGILEHFPLLGGVR